MTPEKSLADILAERMRVREPIPVPVTLAILRQVCDALEYAHNLRDPEGRPLGIVHRALSPAHIFVAETGIVRVVASSTPQGPYAYMAPEFVTSGMLDARADLFALGVVAHEMLANQPLFGGGDERDTLSRVVGQPVAAPSSINSYVPPDLDGIVLTALSRDPAYRWQAASMMRDGLLAVAHRIGLDVSAVPGALWIDLLTERVAPPQPPPARAHEPEPEPEPPPARTPEVWAEDPGDDTNVNTRIEPLDPRMLELANAVLAAEEPVALGSYQAAPAPEAPLPAPNVALGVYESRKSAPAPAVAARDALAPYEAAPAPAADIPIPQVALGRYEAAPQDLPPTVHARMPTADPAPAVVVPRTMTPRPSRPAMPRPAPAPVASEPLSFEMPPAPVAPPPVEPEPEPPPPATPRPMFEPELGPEPTQIGAMPLISFGNTPLVSLVGEDPRRASAAALAPPVSVGTFVPDAEPAPAPRNKKRLILIGAIGVAVAIVLIVIVLVAT